MLTENKIKIIFIQIVEKKRAINEFKYFFKIKVGLLEGCFYFIYLMHEKTTYVTLIIPNLVYYYFLVCYE